MGKARDTLVVYLGDHGADMLRGKRTSYEGGVRIPLIVRWPAAGTAGQVRKELVSTIDLVPAVLAATGAPPLPGLAGKSLLPLLRGDTPPWRRHLFTEFHTHASNEQNFYPQRTVRNERHKLIENLMPGEVNQGYAFTLGHLEGDLAGAIAVAPADVRAAYERMRVPPRFELYDLEVDPYEFRDLAADPAQAGVLAGLQRELAAWRQATADPLLKPENLARLKEEIARADSKRSAKAGWRYPEYFFEDPGPGSGPGAKAGRRRAVPKKDHSK